MKQYSFKLSFWDWIFILSSSSNDIFYTMTLILGEIQTLLITMRFATDVILHTANPLFEFLRKASILLSSIDTSFSDDELVLSFITFYLISLIFLIMMSFFMTKSQFLYKNKLLLLISSILKSHPNVICGIICFQTAAIAEQNSDDKGILAWSIVLFLASSTIGLLTSIIHSPFMKNGYYSSSFSYQESMGLIYKILDSFISNFFKSSWLRGCVGGPLLLLRIILISYFPYFKMKLNIKMLGMAIIDIFSFLISILLINIDANFQILTFFYLISILFGFKISEIFANRLKERIIFKQESSLNIFELKILIRNLLSFDSHDFIVDNDRLKYDMETLVIKIYFKKHSERCMIKTCNCKNFSKKSQNAMLDEFKIWRNNLIQEIFASNLEKLKSNPDFLIFYCNFLAKEHIFNKPKLLVLVNKIKQRLKSYNNAICNNLLASFEKIKFDQDEKKEIDVNLVFRFFDERDEFQSTIKSYTQIYLKFWKEAIEKKLNLDQVKKTSRDLDNLGLLISKKYKSLVNISRKLSITQDLMYSYFLELIRNNPLASIHLREQYFKLYKKDFKLFKNWKISEETISNDSTISLIISMQTAYIGDIKDCSKSISLLGYQKENLIGKNIDQIVPFFTKLHHQNTLREFLDTSKPVVDFSNRAAFFLHEEGYLVRTWIYLYPVPNFVEEFQYGAFIRVVKEKHEFIILNSRGFVYGLSKELFYGFRIPKGLFENKPLHLSKLTLEFEKLEKFLDSRNFEDHEKLFLENQNFNIDIVFHHFDDFKSQKILCNITILEHTTFNEKKYVLKINYSNKVIDKKDRETDLISESEIKDQVKMIPIFDYDPIELKNYYSTDFQNLKKNSKYQSLLKEKQASSASNFFSKHENNKEKIVKKPLSSSKNSNEKNKFQLLEKYIHTKKFAKSDVILAIIVVGHFLIAISILVAFAFNSSSALDRIPKVFELSTVNFDRTYNYEVNIFFNNAMIKYFCLGYYTEIIGIPGPVYFYQSLLVTDSYTKKIIKYSQKFLDVMEYLEESSKAKFFEKVRVRNYLNHSLIEYKSFLDYDKITASAMVTQYSKRFTEFSTYDTESPELTFNMINNWDDTFILGENFYHHIASDIEQKLDNINRLAIFCCITISLAEFLLFLFSVYNELLLKGLRAKFIEMLNHISKEELINEMELIKKFDQRLVKEESFEDFDNEINSKTFKKMAKVKQNFIRVDNINIKPKLALLGISLFHLLIGGGCVYIFTTILAFSPEINQNVQDSIQTNLYLTKSAVVMNSLYDYMLKGNTMTIRNNNYDIEWEKNYRELVESATFLNSLKSKVESEFVEDVTTVLSGDLCSIMYAQTQCYFAEKAQQGLLGVNSILAESARQLKKIFDSSQKSFNDISVIVNSDSFLGAQSIFWLYQPPAFQILDLILQKNTLKKIDSIVKLIKDMIIIFCFAFITLIYFLWYPSWKIYKDEREEINMIFRYIPMKIITTNLYVKNYFIINTGANLNSIKL